MRSAGLRLLSVLLLPALLAAAGPGTWAPSGDCTPKRFEQAAGPLADGRVLVTGGQSDPPGNYLTSAKLFQPPASWSDAASMGQPRGMHTQTLLADGRILVTGGRILHVNPDGSGLFEYLQSAEIYTPSTNTWAPAASMNEPRGFHTATLLSNGKVLVAGGVSPVTLSSAEIYDPVLNTWTEVTPMTQPRWAHAAARMADGRVLVAASWLAAMTAEIYDPVANTWTATGFLSSGGSNNYLFPLPDGRLLFCDGTVFTYSTATQTWTQGAPMPLGTNYVSADLMKDGRLIVTGGQDSAAQADVRIYDPIVDTWTLDTPMAGVRYLHSTVTLPDGRVLVACGLGGSGLLAATELYTPTDTTPPVIVSIHATPSSIWPPNGRMVPVALTVTATDNADPAPKSKILTITSNEPAHHGHLGRADWEITGDLTAQLRAEVNPEGRTRLYTIVVRCTDASGNFADKSVTVAVKR
jgi:hypothetical protein